MDRLIEIETKLAFQDDAIQTLNDVICRQQLEIERLEDTVKLLIERYRQLADAAPNANKPTHEIPPHY